MSICTTAGTKNACVAASDSTRSSIALGTISRTMTVRPPAYMLPSAQPVPQSVEKRRELGADYDEHGLAVVEDVDELLGGQPEVHDGVDGADHRGRQGQLHARGVVLVEHGEPVSWTHARGAQRPRGTPDAVIDLRPGPAPVAER